MTAGDGDGDEDLFPVPGGARITLGKLLYPREAPATGGLLRPESQASIGSPLWR